MTIAPGGRLGDGSRLSDLLHPYSLGSRLVFIQNCDAFIPLPCRDITGAGERTIEVRELGGREGEGARNYGRRAGLIGENG